MAEFELIFAVDSLSDDAIDAIYDCHDALVAGHGDMTLLTVTANGSNAVSAAKSIVGSLEAIKGIVVQRCYEDLVNRRDIADRCNVSAQAVGLWARGDRRKEDPFPSPFNLVGGGVWLWGEVNEWLRRTLKQHDKILYPCRADYTEINRWIAERRAHRQVISVDISWQTHDQVVTKVENEGAPDVVYERDASWATVIESWL